MVIANRYRLLRRLGAGGFGEVWLAQLIFENNQGVEVSSREVALKLFLDKDGAAWNFENEVVATEEIRHPGVCRITDGGFDASSRCHWIAMEYADGGSLRMELDRREKRLPESVALPLFKQAVDALSAAEARGVVHRDINPRNLLLKTTSGGEVELLVADFGIAALRSQVDPHPGGYSRPYSSPEQIKGRGFTSLSDQYSLGVTFYEVLTGKRPRDEQIGPFDPGEMASEPLRSIIRRLTQREPADRFEDFATLQEALRRQPLVDLPLPMPPIPRPPISKLTVSACFLFVAVITSLLMWKMAPELPPAAAPVMSAAPSGQPASGATPDEDVEVERPRWVTTVDGDVEFGSRYWRTTCGSGTHHDASVALQRANVGLEREMQWRLADGTDRQALQVLTEQGAPGLAGNEWACWCDASRAFMAMALRLEADGTFREIEVPKSQSLRIVLVRARP